jgi:hypothetical protein
MIVNESDEARPRHHDEQQDQDPGHRRPLLGHGEAGSSRSTAKLCIMPSSLGRWAVVPYAPRPAAECWAPFERSKSASGEKRIKTTRPKSRRREQGTEVKLCPLRLNTTEGALKKEARFNSTANGPAARGEHAAEKAAQGRQGSERSRTAPKSRATRRQVRRRGGLLTEGGARHVNTEPSPVGTSPQ